MLISHRKHFIYLKTFKTASTSVEVYFEKYCIPAGEKWEFTHYCDSRVSDAGIIGARGANVVGMGWWNHMLAGEIKNRLKPQIWDDYLKFCNVRNPFQVFISSFFYDMYLDDTQKKKEYFRSLRSSSAKILKLDNMIIQGFRKYLINIIKKFSEKNSQYMINGEVCIDYFIQYENLEEGVEYICEKLDIPFEPEKIPKLNSGFRDYIISEKKFYDDKSIAIINKTFPWLIERFGYSVKDL